MIEFYDESREIQPDSCKLWKEDSPIKFDLQVYETELEAYIRMVDNFQPMTTDLRSQFHDDYSNREEVCSQVDLFRRRRDGVGGAASTLFDLSRMSNSDFIEPILPPFRHPAFCSKSKQGVEYNYNSNYITDVNYMVHDFGNMCHNLKKTSKTILIDMGASLQFHAGNGEDKNPALYLPKLYQKFGMKFDHIYAYEINQKDTNEVYNLLPEDMQASYHWINMGVSGERDSVSNPFKMLLANYNEDDLVVVKLDIDHSDTEQQLIQHILKDYRLQKLIDQFYFEDQRIFLHQTPKGKPYFWGVEKNTWHLFTLLRKVGIAAHVWV